MNTQLVNSIIEVVRALPTEEQSALLETLNHLFQPLRNEDAIAAISSGQIPGLTPEAASTNHDLGHRYNPMVFQNTVVLKIDNLRNKLLNEHGNFADSTELICEDRER